MMYAKLFPSLADRKWIEVNLDQLAQADFPETDGPNVLLDPDTCARWIEAIHDRLGADFSFGGMGENRAHLWRGSYLTEFFHLGVDFNVPAGTPVHAVEAGSIWNIEDDYDQDGGWGGKVTISDSGKASLIYAHLDQNSIVHRIGTRIEAGDVIGIVGTTATNGGWFPHLHIQAFQGFPPQDGYGTERDAKNEWRYPNPILEFVV